MEELREMRRVPKLLLLNKRLNRHGKCQRNKIRHLQSFLKKKKKKSHVGMFCEILSEKCRAEWGCLALKSWAWKGGKLHLLTAFLFKNRSPIVTNTKST
jgi:hypothetical protein